MATRMRALHDEQRALVDDCDLSADAAADVYRSMAAVVQAIVELETEALASLR